MFVKGNAHYRATDSARVTKVLETRALIGRGTEDDPHRFLYRYWSFDGKLLAESDESKMGSK